MATNELPWSARPLLQKLAVGKERIEDLKTAVSEACLNAVEHGNKGRPEARVVISMHLGDKDFRVSVKDEGNGIPHIPQTIDIRRKVERLEPPNGLGLFLIQQLVDRVDFNKTTDGGHVVNMVLKMENQPAPCPRDEDQTPTVIESTR